jgi:hypothetical protein
MNSVVTVKKQVEEIKQRIMPKPRRDKVIAISSVFGSDDGPHGPYRNRKWHMMYDGVSPEPISYFEACTKDEEIAILKDYYENDIPKHAKRQHEGFAGCWEPYSWATFEDFLENSRCKCGKHGPSGLEPFYGDVDK